MDGLLRLVGIFAGLVSLSLIVNPEICQKVKNSFRTGGLALVRSARDRLEDIKKYWNRTNAIRALEEHKDDIIPQIADYEERQRITRMKRRAKQRKADIEGSALSRLFRFGKTQQPPVEAPRIDIDYEQIGNEAQEAAAKKFDRIVSSQPGSAIILEAWFRRLLYTGMLIVMITTDVGITVYRLEALGFFTIPMRLQPYLNKVFLLTPLVLISSILLAKMALDETGDTLSPFAKLVPFERGKGKIGSAIRKLFPYVVLILGLSNSLLLVYAAASIGAGTGETSFQAYEFLLFVGLLLLTLLASYMAATALFQTIILIASVPFLLIIAAIAVICGVSALIISAYLGLLENIGNLLKRVRGIPLPGRRKGGVVASPPLAPADGTILLGLGKTGAQMAAGIASVLRELERPLGGMPALLYADVYASDVDLHKRSRDQLRGLARYSPQITVETTTPERDLSGTLANVHPVDATEAATIVCLVRDGDITMSIAALKQYEQYVKDARDMQHNAAQNPIRILLIWRLSRQSRTAEPTQQADLTQAAHDLEAWANDKDSLLAGTILISDDSSLISDVAEQEQLIARALATFIMSSHYENTLSLEEMARQMKSANHAFSALATGTIGIPSVVVEIDGKTRAAMNDGFLSLRLKTLLEEYFDNTLTSFSQAPTVSSVAKFVTVLCPQPQRKTFLTTLRSWMAEPPFGIEAENVAFIPADLSPKINLSVSTKFTGHAGDAHPQLSLIYTLDRGIAAPSQTVSSEATWTESR